MSTDDNMTYRSQRLIGILSLMLGIGLLLRASDLPTEFVRVSNTAAARAIAAPVEMMCWIPEQAAAPAIKVLSRYIAHRFHLAETAAVGITHAAFTAARTRGINPMLVLAVAAVESKFKTRAVNPVTGATGLMQVMPQWHQDKIINVGGDPSLLLIAPNIDVGAAILSDYFEAANGDLDTALGRYLGSADGARYFKKVQTEMAHMTRVFQTI